MRSYTQKGSQSFQRVAEASVVRRGRLGSVSRATRVKLPFRAKWKTSGCVSSGARNHHNALTGSYPQIYIDRKSQTVVFPIHGYAVPFHINTIKNVSKSEEAEFTTLRVNFQTPGQLAGRKEDTVSTMKY